MLKHVIMAGMCSSLVLSSATLAQAGASHTPDDHAPIGVMGDHLHKKGSWMVGYKYEFQRSSGLRNGRDSIPTSQALATYGEVPTKMDMTMHMFEIMYGLTDKLTLMAMPQYMKMEMTHLAHGGHGAHAHEIDGFGDTEVTGLYSVLDTTQNGVQHKAHLNIGMSLPTGATDETFMNHHHTVYNLPYNMQLGSGTFDPIIGATYTGKTSDWSWGAQTLNTIRMGKNDEGYRLGNKYTATTWVARNLTDFASLSFRLEGEAWENVEGSDPSLPITAIAGADPDEQAGERILAHIGLNLLAGENLGVLAGHRVAAEFGLPIYERYSGPQAETDYRFTLGWQKAF